MRRAAAWAANIHAPFGIACRDRSSSGNAAVPAGNFFGIDNQLAGTVQLARTVATSGSFIWAGTGIAYGQVGPIQTLRQRSLEPARTALSEQSKAILLQMAHVWNRLADEHDRLGGIVTKRTSAFCWRPSSSAKSLQACAISCNIRLCWESFLYLYQAITLLRKLALLR